MSNLPIRGLVHVTGEPDSGKTTFALSTGVEPSKIAMLDDDLKGQAIADALTASGTPLGLYRNLHREFSSKPQSKPVAFHNMVMGILAEIKGKDFEVLIFDNWTRMEDSIRAKSLEIMTDISDLTQGQIRAMSQLTWPYTYNYYADVLDAMLGIAPLVFVTTHVRKQYVGNQATGMLEPRGQRPLTEKSSLRVWLRHNPDSPKPIGLILKRIARMQMIDGALTPVNILPRRVNPCTWDKIREYLNDPMGDRQAREDETPNAFELSILDGTLTDDQKDALRLARIAAEEEGSMSTIEHGTIAMPKQEVVEQQPVREFTDEEVAKATRIRDQMDPSAATIFVAHKVAPKLNIDIPTAIRLLNQLPEQVF